MVGFWGENVTSVKMHCQNLDACSVWGKSDRANQIYPFGTALDFSGFELYKTNQAVLTGDGVGCLALGSSGKF